MRRLSHTTLFCGVTTLSISLANFANAESGESQRWLDNITGNVAVDGFYLVDWNFPDNPADVAAETVAHRAFDHTSGFALAFAILDLAYEGENFGATLNFRYGEGANRLLGADGDPVFQTLKQAFVTWSPTETLSFDFGQFDTIYGAEVADSWQNLNYTRGALYFLMQPFYHTGLRVGIQASDQVALTFLLVNGTNNTIDDGMSPHIGAQVSLSPSDSFFAAIGYYGGAPSSGFGIGAGDADPEESFEHFFDLVINASLGPVSLVGNADLYISSPDTIAANNQEPGTSIYWGVSLAAGMPFSETFSAAIRGELLGDPDRFFGATYESLATGTITLDYHPSPHVIIRLDNRIEIADEGTFVGSDYVPDNPSTLSDTWFATTLGVVVTASP